MDGNVHSLYKALQMQSLLIGHFSETPVLVVQPKGAKKDLPGHLSQLLLVAIENDSGLRSYVCRNCLATAQSIESKLQRFHEMAQESLQKLQVQGSKHLKDSTGVGASSYTQKVQPPAKKLRTLVQLFHHQGYNGRQYKHNAARLTSSEVEKERQHLIAD